MGELFTGSQEKVNQTNPHDDEYLSIVRLVLKSGVPRNNRTGVRTIQYWSHVAKFDLRSGFPLLTTKKISFEAVKAELFWFLSASTNVNDLPEKFRFIWLPWADDAGNLSYVYGKEWTDFAGTNQIEKVRQELNSNPDSRRLLFTAWNPVKVWSQEHKSPPACHTFAQLNAHENMLDLQLYMRSCDVGIGLPYNIASYALLLSMFAVDSGRIPRFLTICFGDLHIYENHIDGLQEQLSRGAYSPPSLQINRGSFWSIRAEDCKLYEYKSHSFIRLPIAI